MDPDEYQHFPSFWPDPRLRRWNLWGYVDVRDVAAVTASESGVLSARRAGARIVVGVQSGVHDGSRLRRD